MKFASSLFVVGAAAVALSACSAPVPTGTTASGIATRYTVAGGNATPGSIDAVNGVGSDCNQTTCTYSDVRFFNGPLGGRTLQFSEATGQPILNPGETGFLETISAGTAEATLIAVQTGASGEDNIYALYKQTNSAVPNTGSASYVGDVVAQGFSPTGHGTADGTYSAFVSFTGATVIGQVNNVTFRNGGTFPVIRFTADLEQLSGAFVANSVQIDGGIPTTGHLEGGVDQTAGVSTGAFSVNSGAGPEATSYGLTGVFAATKQ